MRTLVLLLCLCFLCPGSLAAKRPSQPKTISTPVPVLMQPPVLTGKVNLVWQHKNLPAVDVSNLPRIEGLNVVSPCWYGCLDNVSQPTRRVNELSCIDPRFRSVFSIFSIRSPVS